jgi:hypothetical protein
LSLYWLERCYFKYFIVTALGIQLFLGQQKCVKGVNRAGDLLNRVYFLDAFEFQETQASNCEVRMEDINHITWAVSETASFRILHRVSSDDTLVDNEASTPDSAEYM